ncbi:tannase/feruloyl esterase family alpha/beta hydrolase [Caulobacter sp. RL271]|uniref:Tannase/feruloyl esterase family alpha/beta hydrolase n=1 Tax=Caulobacter segnis TaxID=88688 RepID=A0ABY4ZZ39_9CAUL|nr:tannase/feruloyl esterase family alpha/beta hydrolase [Caulobacter segnis]USQ98078.1 tannase/feruloyl esterase family alpha/beta hydrolase [Caulobacter segnis]
MSNRQAPDRRERFYAALRRGVALAVAALAWGMASQSWAASCEALADLQLPDTVIKSATTVPAGGMPGLTLSPETPAFCRVVASVRAAPDSDVGVEVWLPLTGWKGVFHGNGNGGFGGVLPAGYGAMAAGVRRGYASAVTDTGTAPATPLEGDALIGHPRKWRDWGRLSAHVMTVTGKAIAQAYYGAKPERAFYTGCSTGGQQGLIEALYYPEDYDGILVGAPVINRTWGHAAVLWNDLAANLWPGSHLSDAKLRTLNTAVLARCGGRGSGLASDPFLGDPRACRFDPATLLCRGGDGPSCLTRQEVATVRAFYSGPTDRRGRAKFFGWPKGSEAPGHFGWDFLQSRPKGQPPFVSLFKWVFGADWNWAGFQVERDMPKVDAALDASVNDATRGDLRAFRARGGKLIVYHGWADSLVPPDQTIAFYDRVARDAGGIEKAQSFARLFMAPGVAHCGGGPGPDAFNAANGVVRPPPSATLQYDLFTALSAWVGRGAAPSRVIATRYVGAAPAEGVALQRPLCAYPAKAWYRGVGDTNDARNFVCSVAKPALSKQPDGPSRGGVD